MRRYVAILVGVAVLSKMPLVSGIDCNTNGIPDEEDLLSGASSDEDRSGVPDECENLVNLIVVGPSELAISITHVVPLFGFRLELGHESSAGQPRNRAAKDYGIGEGSLSYRNEPTCPMGELDAVATVRWNTYEPDGLPPGEHATIGLGFPELVRDDCTRIEIICSRVEVLGADGKLLPNTVVTGGVDVCQFEAEVFHRGDADGWGAVTIADAIAILSFLFVGNVRLECLDAADSSDQGSVDITSALYILHWLFGGGSSPSYPGPFQCGFDATPDLLDCASYARCPQR